MAEKKEGESLSAAGRDALAAEVLRLRRENAALREKLAALEAKAGRADSGKDGGGYSALLDALTADVTVLKGENAAMKKAVADCGKNLAAMHANLAGLTNVVAKLAQKITGQ